MRLLLIVVGCLLALNLAASLLGPMFGYDPGRWSKREEKFQDVLDTLATARAGPNAPKGSVIGTIPTGRPPGFDHGVDNGVDNEYVRDAARQQARAMVLRTFERGWSSFCTDQGRRQLYSVLSNYFSQRQFQQLSDARRGADAERAGKAAWTTDQDVGIERLTREAHIRGYLKPDSLAPPARQPVDGLVRNDTVTGKGCVG